MKKTILFLSFVAITGTLFAQKKTTTSAVIAFDATTSKDALPKAENKTVIGVLDTKTGTVAFEATVKNFSFRNERMQEHFNSDTWMSSDTYPKIEFTGKINDLTKINFKKDGTYTVSVSGDLTIKGITKPVTATGVIVIAGDVLNASTDFSVSLADYGISAPPVEGGKVSREPKITVSAVLQ